MATIGLASLPQCDDAGLNKVADAIRANDAARLSLVLKDPEINPNKQFSANARIHPTMLHYAIWLDSAKSGSAVSYGMFDSFLRNLLAKSTAVIYLSSFSFGHRKVLYIVQ